MRKNPPAKWALPETIDPATTKCYQINVPDDPAHIAAFRGALLGLASAYNWADDPAHKAKDVAAVWRDILDNHLEFGCEGNMQLRACTDGCGLEYSNDGINWTCVDISGCIENIWDEKLAQAFDDGVLGQNGNQGSPEAPPTGVECRTFHVVLQGKDLWHCPIPVEAGYTIQVINPTGGWWDGGVSLVWSCPDGRYYGLGSCYGSWSGQATDPIPTAKHMQLIGRFGATYFDPLTAAYIVPGGTAQTDFVIQANDGNIADNSGQVQFDVEVCSGDVPWCYEFDFTLGSYEADGWSARNPGESTYVGGTGWQGDGASGNTSRDVIKLALPAPCLLTEVEAWGHVEEGVSWYGYQSVFNQGGNLSSPVINSINLDAHWTGSKTNCTTIGIYWSSGANWNYGTHGTITKVRLHGVGYNPFGVSNC